jgi:hypothetical protein
VSNYRNRFTVRFEVLMMVKMSMLFFQVVISFSDDGDNMFLQNAGIYIQVHMTSQPRRTTSTDLLYFMITNLAIII